MDTIPMRIVFRFMLGAGILIGMAIGLAGLGLARNCGYFAGDSCIRWEEHYEPVWGTGGLVTVKKRTCTQTTTMAVQIRN